MKFKVLISQEVEVELDETKFDEEFLEEFRKGFYPFYEIEHHVGHLAQLTARGILVTDFSGEFCEGYGYIDDFGIKTKVNYTDIDEVKEVK